MEARALALAAADQVDGDRWRVRAHQPMGSGHPIVQDADGPTYGEWDVPDASTLYPHLYGLRPTGHARRTWPAPVGVGLDRRGVLLGARRMRRSQP